MGVRAGDGKQGSGVYLQPRWWPGFYSSCWTCIAEFVIFMELGMKQRDKAVILALLWEGRKAGFRFWLCFSFWGFTREAQACKLFQSQHWMWGGNRVLASQLCPALLEVSVPLPLWCWTTWSKTRTLEHKVVTREMQKTWVTVSQGRGEQEKCSALITWVSSHLPGQTPAGGWSLGHAFGCWDAS